MKAGRPFNPRYVAVLTAVATTILVAGWLLRPRATTETPAPLPSESEVADLARRAERRAIDDTTRFFAAVVRDAAPAVLSVQGARSSALDWAPREMLAPPLSTGSVTVVGENRERALRTVVAGPSLPFTLLAWTGDGPDTPTGRDAIAMPASGASVIAVWRSTRTPSWGPGYFEEIHPVRCGDYPFDEIVTSFEPRAEMRGGGLFDLDGSLLGPILPCNGRLAVLTTASVRSLVERERQPDRWVQHALGVVLTPIGSPEARHFSAAGQGLLVRETWTDAAADRAGLRPGDVLVSLDDRPLAGPADVRPLAVASEAARRLTVQRGARQIIVSFEDAVAVPPAARSPVAGATFVDRTEAYMLDTVAAGSRAAAADLRPGDRLIAIDFTEIRSREQAIRLLRRPVSMWLEVGRGARRIGTLLPEIAP